MSLRLKITVSLIAVILSLLLNAHMVIADTIPVTITANNLTYDYEQKQIEALGDVRIKYKEYKIEADYALIDQNENVLLATGHVVVEKEGNQYSGNRFLYYIKTQKGWLAPVKSNITDAEIKGEVFFSSDEAFIEGENLRLHTATFTSCDLDHPHYHFTAKEIEYYPDDRMILHRVWYWEGKYKIMYLPYMFISLKDDRNNFEVRVGQTGDWGWYLFVGYGYSFNSDSYGKIYTNITERGGDGIGIKHTIKGTPTSSWYQDVYINDLSDKNIPYQEYKYEFGYFNWTDPKQNFKFRFENWHRYNYYWNSYLENKLELFYNGLRPYPRISFEFYDLSDKPNRYVNIWGDWSYLFSPTWNNTIFGRWLYTEDLSMNNPKDSFEYKITSTKNWGNTSLSFTYSDYQSTGIENRDNFKPDILLTIPNINIPIIGQFSLKTEYMVLDKFPENLGSGTQWSSDIMKTWSEIWKTDNGLISIGYSMGAFFRLYNTDAGPKYPKEGFVTAYDADIGINFKISKHLSTQFGYGQTQMNGINNNFFPSSIVLIPGGSVQNDTTWESGPWKAVSNLIYSINNDKFEPLKLNVTWNPDQKSYANLMLSYNLLDGPETLNFNMTYNPKENLLLQTSIGYNFTLINNPWTSRSFYAKMMDKLTDKWSYELLARYDSLANKFSLGVINFIYDWHCRDVIFHFDTVQREFWIQVSIKAFPNSGLRLGKDPMEFVGL